MGLFTFSFVRFYHLEECKKLISLMNGARIDGEVIRADLAQHTHNRLSGKVLEDTKSTFLPVIFIMVLSRVFFSNIWICLKSFKFTSNKKVVVRKMKYIFHNCCLICHTQIGPFLTKIVRIRSFLAWNGRFSLSLLFKHAEPRITACFICIY